MIFMKRTAAALITAIFITLSACSPAGEAKPAEGGIITGVWISCYELYNMLESENFKEIFAAAAGRMSEFGISDAFVHVRAFGDSLFDSEYYPRNSRTLGFDFDVMQYMVDVLKKKKIRFHAWINPFRTADGGFNSPADEKVRRDIVCGVREILNNYDVDGIHIDDYFYPPSDAEIDKNEYESYRASAENAATTEEYRKANVTSLIFAVKNAIKRVKPEAVFSISPAADINKNENEAFADVRYWCENAAADMIIPQLYFGFDYPDESFRFEKLLDDWRSIKRADGVKLVIGIPEYKLGTDSGPDAEEWREGVDLPAKQVARVLECGDVSGVCFFSYSSLFGDSPLRSAARGKVNEVIKKAAAAKTAADLI